MKCPYCDIVEYTKADLNKHVQVFHPNLAEVERKRQAQANPVKYIVEKGFAKELSRVAHGKCPCCAQQVRPEELTNQAEWDEFKLTGLCGNCHKKWSAGKL